MPATAGQRGDVCGLLGAAGVRGGRAVRARDELLRLPAPGAGGAPERLPALPRWDQGSAAAR